MHKLPNLTIEQMKAALINLIQARGYTYVEDTDEVARAVELDVPIDVPMHRVPSRAPDGKLAARGDAVGGATIHPSRVVVVRDDLTPMDQLQVIAHELSHVALQHQHPDSIDRIIYLATKGGMNKIYAIKELEAELTAYQLMSIFGYGSDDVSLSYITGYGSTLGEDLSRLLFNRIAEKAGQKAADLMFEIIESGE